MSDLAAFALAVVVLFIYFFDRLMGRLTPKSNFPICFTHRKTCIRQPITNWSAMPQKIKNYLTLYELPDSIVSRYVCPKGDVVIWYAPQAGKAEKGVIAVQRI